jgi:lysyl-tRNA synthetase class 1
MAEDVTGKTPAGSAETHWADTIAAELTRARGDHHLSTGISPSGEIHVGNLREVMTGDILTRAIRDAGKTAALHYFADDFDPLRRVYPFLDKKAFEPHLGKPISRIPCPCSGHPSYSEHFLEPFLASLPRLGIDLEVFRSSQVYGSGRMVPLIIKALEQRDRLATILEEITGRETVPGWSPFQVVCTGCGRMTQAKVRGFSAADETVDYSCGCGSEGSVPMAGGGKLQWRIDWPARWTLLEVTVEPFGKDHASRGGSYDAGVRIIREVFGAEPPHPVPYEWINLRGRGDMSSSKGNVVAIAEVLDAVPPEVMRYLIARARPMKTISLEEKGTAPRIIELCRVEGFRPVGVPFRHLVSVLQMAAGNFGQAVRILERGGHRVDDRDGLRQRFDQARVWLDRFAPDEEKFSIQETLPATAANLTAAQKKFLSLFADRLTPEMDGEGIHRLIYELKDEAGLEGPREAFQAIYLVLLDKRSGPRAGWFLSILETDFVRTRFREAAAA